MECLALLRNSTEEEIKESVNFFVTDRASDCSTKLHHLDVDKSKSLKCSAHLILGVDYACEQLFMKAGQMIDVQKLIPIAAGEKVFKSGSSFYTLDLIGIAKLLSLSHAAHSISPNHEYIQWMDAEGIEHTGFKGFVTTRFGRIEEIAKEFLARKESIMNFFDALKIFPLVALLVIGDQAPQSARQLSWIGVRKFFK